MEEIGSSSLSSHWLLVTLYLGLVKFLILVGILTGMVNMGILSVWMPLPYHAQKILSCSRYSGPLDYYDLCFNLDKICSYEVIETGSAR